MTTSTTLRLLPPIGSRPSRRSKVKNHRRVLQMPGVLPLPSDDYLGGHIPGAVFFSMSAPSPIE